MFWAHTYTDWTQIEPPTPHGEWLVHALNLDWKRFITDQTIDFIRVEAAPLKELAPHIPTTTNFMGTYGGIDYWKVKDAVDVVSWDSYPQWHGPGSDTGTRLAHGLRSRYVPQLQGRQTVHADGKHAEYHQLGGGLQDETSQYARHIFPAGGRARLGHRPVLPVAQEPRVVARSSTAPLWTIAATSTRGYSAMWPTSERYSRGWTMLSELR